MLRSYISFNIKRIIVIIGRLFLSLEEEELVCKILYRDLVCMIYDY